MKYCMKKILQHLFIPSESNDYRSKLMHIDGLSYYLFIIMIISLLYRFTPLVNVLGIATDMSVARLYELTNQKRAENGAGPLQHNGILDNAACDKAQKMIAGNCWAHFCPNGASPWTSIANAGYRYAFAGENLCKNFSNSEGCVNAWMNSPSHRKNMLKSGYRDVGFCVMNGNISGEDTTLVVQMFGTPPARSIVRTVGAAEQTQKPIAQIKKKAVTQKKAVAAAANKNKAVKGESIINVPDIFTTLIRQLVILTPYLLVSILCIALLFDFYYAFKLNLLRITGKHIAHGIFLLVIVASFFIITKGAIL